MTGIPSDIVETAAALAAEISCSSRSAFVPPDGIDMIERAILAERERCAKVASCFEAAASDPSIRSDIRSETAQFVASRISAAIRGGDEP